MTMLNHPHMGEIISYIMEDFNINLIEVVRALANASSKISHVVSSSTAVTPEMAIALWVVSGTTSAI